MKYTIELTENQKKQMDFMLDMANKHMGFNRKLEMIETTNVEATNEYQIGYKVGLEDGNKIADKDLKEIQDSTYDVAYTKGVEDFENLFVHEHDYEQFFEDTYGSKDPDYNLYDLVAEYGAKKVLDDFKKWQEEKKKREEEIKVGDEVVVTFAGFKGIVLSIYSDERYRVIYKDGIISNEEKK
ncbi:hypothetical protein [Pseudobutyrivibrio sp.]